MVGTKPIILRLVRAGFNDAGFVVDYVEARTPELQKIHTFNQDLVLFIAAKLGNTRLIDNLQVKYTAG
jgi:pantoate--beta-alanine ligase